MKKLSKRLAKLNSFKTKDIYSFEEAIKLLKEFKSLKFLESVEAHISLNIDPKYANQQLRTSLILPHGTGKQLKIAVFAEPENFQSIREMGAHIVGGDDLIEDISAGNLNFDVLITSPELMPKLAKLGKILGPKALMPSPKSGTVSKNLKESISEFKKGKIEYRADKTGIVHLSFGKIDFSEQELTENLLAVYESIEKNKPSGVKGRYFKSFYLCTTMSPSLKVDLTSFQ